MRPACKPEKLIYLLIKLTIKRLKSVVTLNLNLKLTDLRHSGMWSINSTARINEVSTTHLCNILKFFYCKNFVQEHIIDYSMLMSYNYIYVGTIIL